MSRPSAASSSASPSSSPGRLEHALALICLAAALFWQFQTVTLEWSSTALPGNAFRQTQTGHSTRFIVEENNYALAYPTPILGRPWSIPMEFPLYQWTVAKLTQHSSLTLVESARTVSLLGFYASLPAFWLLAALAGVPVARRWWCLIPVILSPVTILYGRAFLIETMAVAFAAWFVLSFILMLRHRSVLWLAATALFGVLTGLTKATTLLAAGIPCAVIGLRTFFATLKTGDRADARALVGWGAAAAFPAFVATWWWTRFADTTKALNPIGQALSSDKLTGFNFGEHLIEGRFTWDRWSQLFAQWDLALAPALLIGGLAVVAAVLSRRLRGPALLCLATFLGTQVIFPNLYSIHDYYFTAIAGVAALGWGLTLCGVAEQARWGRGAALVLLGGLAWAQIATFDNNYRQGMVEGSAGDDLTNGLYRLTEDDEVIIIAGDEWNSVIPFYAQRRALMLPFGTVNRRDILAQAFANLDPNEVAALVMVREERTNQAFLDYAAEVFDFAREPLLRVGYADVYFTRRVMAEILPADADPNQVGGDPLQVYADTMRDRSVMTASLSKRQQRLFGDMSPLPEMFYFEFGPAVLNTDAGTLLNAHATTRLTFDPPPGAHEITIEYGMFDSVWQNEDMQSDGVELVVDRLPPDGPGEELFRRLLDPRGNEADRGLHTLRLPLALAPGDKVVVRAEPGPADNRSFDWFFLREILIQ